VDPEVPLVVLVHGFAGSASYYTYLARRLVKSGRRVLRYDNYGRGFSVCTGQRHSKHLFASQLAEVLFKLNVTSKIDLVGYSMGGGIVAAFAAAYPERLASLVLLAPAVAGVQPLPSFLVPLALRSEWVRSWVLERYVLGVLDLGAAGAFKRAWKRPDGERAIAQKSSLRWRLKNEAGLARALVDTLAHFQFTVYVDELAAIASASYPVLLMWGTEDEAVPYPHSSIVVNRLASGGKGADRFTFVTWIGHSHDFPIEFAEETADLIVRFSKGERDLGDVK